MTKKPWFADSVVYQIYPMSFQDTNHDGIGDLRGITQHLPYIHKLGANYIWLNPIYDSPNKDNGYDISDYESIHPNYGNMNDFDELLKVAHQNHIGIIMDLVFNHTSDQHEWFKASAQSKDNPYSDYYIWHDPVDGHEPNDWEGVFQGSAWTYVASRNQYYLHSFLPEQPDLNWANPKVRKSLEDVMKFWLDKGVDGFRLDAIDFIAKPKFNEDGGNDNFKLLASAKPDLKKLNHYLQDINQNVLSKYDHVLTVGEMATATPDNAAKFANLNGSELSMVFQFEHVDLAPNPNPVLNKWYDGKIKLTELKATFNRWQVGLNQRGWNSLYWDNHDQPRAVSRFATHDPKYRVVGAKMLAATLHMMQGTPYVYEGEEIGMTNDDFTELGQYEDADSINAYHRFVDQLKVVDNDTMLKYLADRSRDNARTPMQWDGTPFSGFSDVKPWFNLNHNYETINVKAALADPDSVFYHYQKLIQIRRNNDVIKYGDFTLLDADDDQVFAYQRQYDGHTVLVISNFTDQTITRDYQQVNGALLLGNYVDDKGTTLRPFESKIYQLN